MKYTMAGHPRKAEPYRILREPERNNEIYQARHADLSPARDDERIKQGVYYG